MALYMTQFSYTADAWKALVKKPEDRAAVFARCLRRLVSISARSGLAASAFSLSAPGGPVSGVRVAPKRSG